MLLETVRAVTSSCRALSIGRVEDGLLHTVDSTQPLAAGLDALQYMDDGPSPMSVDYGTRVEARLGPPDADWGLLGFAGRLVGVGSVLSLPVPLDGAVAGTLTLYGGDADAFDRHLPRLTGALSKAISEAVSDAAEPLRHRLTTALLPEPIRDQNAIDWAIGSVAGHLHIHAAVAADLFRRAATRSGLSDSALAVQVTEWLGAT